MPKSTGMRVGSVCLLLLAAAAPALASSLPRGSVSADCDSYTVTFDAEGFVDPGDTITVDFRIVMVAGEETRTETHTETITGSGAFSVSFSYPWNPPVCGTWTFLEGGADGSRYDWVNNHGGSSAEAITITAPPDKILTCSCDEPSDEICRTPGFWGTHAGTEKRRSQDITGAVIDAAAGGHIFVCGKFLDTTELKTSLSAEEALCVSPRGDRKLQLARHLTAAALNCVISGANDGCEGLSIEGTFASCNEICAGAPGSIGECIDALSCFNEGGRLLPSGMCQVGTCSDDGDPCNEDSDCGGGRGCRGGSDVTCVPLPGNCHDRPLVNVELGLDFDPPGPAGSPDKCNSAERNDCTIFSCDGQGGNGGHGGHGGHGGCR